MSENPTVAETVIPGMPVITQKSYPNVRLHIQGDKLFAMWDVVKPGIVGRLDHVAYMVIEGDKFAERGYGADLPDSEAKPLIVLGSLFRPRVDSHIMGIVGNLTMTQENLRPFAAWQIDYAHRNWNVSDRYPDESTIVQFIPDDTAQSKLEYMNMQIGDRNRTITDLERYCSKLQSELNALKTKIPMTDGNSDLIDD